MRIYIDGMFAGRAGIGRVYENLLGALAVSPEVSRIFTIAPRDFRGGIPGLRGAGKIEARFVGYAPLGAWDFFRKGIDIRRSFPSCDLYYFPHFNVPFLLEGTIATTIHDIIPLSAYSDVSPARRLGFRMLVGRALRASSAIACDSAFSRRQLVEEYGVPEDRIRVIHQWLDDGFIRGVEPARAGKRMVEGRYLLFVGSRYGYKNLATLVEAFRLLAPRYSDLRVAIAGRRTRRRDAVDEAAADPVLGNRILQFSPAAEDEVRNLYAFASVLVFPSLIEGFGLPPLEAMAFGVPVVCSDIPVTREICGDAACYADARDPRSFADRIAVLLDDRGERARLSEAGLRRLRSFSKNENAAKYLALFREVSGK